MPTVICCSPARQITRAGFGTLRRGGDFADDKNAGFQGGNQGGAQDRWTFGSDRYENYEPGLSESGLTGVAAPAPPRTAFDGAAYAKSLPGVYATVAPGQQGLWDPLGFCSKSD